MDAPQGSAGFGPAPLHASRGMATDYRIKLVAALTPVSLTSRSTIRRAFIGNLPADGVGLCPQGSQNRLQHVPQAADLIDEIEHDRDTLVVDPKIMLQISDQLGPG